MNIDVLYFAELKDITKKESESFQLTNNNLKGLIDLLVKTYPHIRDLILDPNGQNLRNTISIVKNNQAIHEKDILSITLNDGDSIAFLFPVSGG